MKNEITIILRAFPVIAHDHRTGREEALTITVTKEQLQAATLVGQSSNELLERMLDRHRPHLREQPACGAGHRPHQPLKEV